jgi:exonuclease SbcD
MGEANELNLPSSLLNLEADYIALGHFHDREQITENAWYSGSLERLSFAEAGQEKGYMLVDLERGKKDFVKLPSRPMYSLGPFKAKGKEAGTLQDELVAALSSVKVEGSMVRLVVEDVPAALYRSLDLNTLRTMADKAVHLELKFEIVQGADSVQWRSTSFGSLDQEFETYLSQVPVEGVDKDDLRRRGLEYLRKEDKE